MPDIENESDFDLTKGFVAIRKTSRTANEAFKLSATSPAEKREIIRDDAQHSDRSLELQHGAGLKEIDSPIKANETPKIIKPVMQTGVYARLGYIGAYIVQPQDDKQAQRAQDLLKDDYFIVPNIKMDLPVTVQTELRGSRRSVSSFYPEQSGIQLAHEKGIKGNKVQVMVLDTGCDADHIQFSETKINYRYIMPTDPRKRRNVRGFDPGGHGTHVCGIIAGKDVGVAPDVDLHVASVIESESVETSLRRVLSALDWLMSEVVNQDNNGNAVILNMSLGFKPIWTATGGANIQMIAVRSVLETLVDDFDVLPIVASGNDGPGNLRAPGSFPEVLSVGAVDLAGKQADFTSTGSIEFDGETRQVPDVWGYGVNIYSSLERNSDNRSVYAEKSGTSMATPYTTGIAALYAQHTGLTGNKLRAHLLKNVSAEGIATFAL
jgi:subtilisin family serine protease